MKNHVIVLWLVFILPATSVFSQSGREKAAAEILMLKNGALLIKLKTSENAINGLISAGRTAEAEKLREEQLSKNKEIAQAFTEQITFCKTYFFYSANTNSIKNGDFGSLMNGGLEKDSTFNTINYLIAEFGESTTSKIEGLIIQDRNLVQLDSPFPSFIRTNKAGVKTRTYKEIAEALDNELYDFYNKAK
ncbi:MAG: hypothetical protein K0Q95_799 [Bacteroidota bacterium]|jgi:hypothetical protein|nr:hypothetical protein [Bacteroidota bacterium]